MSASAPPPARHGWLAVAAVTIAAFFLVTAEFLPVGLLPEIARSLDVSEGTAGLMVTAPGLVAMVSAIAVLVVAGTLDRRLVMVGLTALTLVSCVAAAAAPNFAVMLGARLLLGAAIGGFWATGPSLAGRLVTGAAIPKATGMIIAGVSVGTVLGVPAGTLIGHLLDWRRAFGVAAALAAVAVAAQALLLPALPATQATRLADLARLVPRPRVRTGLLTVLFVVAGQFLAYTFVTPFLTQVSDVSSGSVSGLLLAYGAAGLAGNFLAVAASRHGLRTTFAAYGALLATAFVVLGAFGQTSAVAIAALVAWGFAWGAIPLCAQLWIVEATPDNPAGGSALLVSTLQAGIAIGSFGGGIVVDTVGTRSVPWIADALVAVGVGTIAVLGRTRVAADPSAAVPATATAP
jgi:predicted MFS family arabinose efflux permease